MVSLCEVHPGAREERKRLGILDAFGDGLLAEALGEG